jgi:Bacterial dnaA protein helix-turn-helix
MRTSERQTGSWQLSLEQIEVTVADHLGNGRVPGNQAAPCLSRQVSMYLAKNVGGWSTTRIGRFYNGRHHTTVLHAIEKIDRLRHTDESLDALIEVLTVALSPQMEGRFTDRFEPDWTAALVEAVANRVLREIRSRTSDTGSEGNLAVTQGERGISR